MGAAEIREDLDIKLEPLDLDPVSPPPGMVPWQPWTSPLAASMFLATLKDVLVAG
jgi:hypothetical protein